MNRHFHIISALIIMLGMGQTPSHANAVDTKPSAKEKKRPALVTKIWWNQPKKINDLSLTEAQRNQMNELFETYLKTHAKSAKKQNTTFDDLGDTLVKGNSKKTNKQRDKLSKIIAEDVSKQIDMMSAVMNVLTDEQRTLLGKNYPKLTSRLWIRTFKPTAMNSNNKGNKRKIRKKQ